MLFSIKWKVLEGEETKESVQCGGRSDRLALHCIINCDKTPAIYARAAPAKLAVGSATPSLCRHASDADIRHFIHN